MTKFYTLLALVGLAITTNAQTTIGMRGGANYSNVMADDEYGVDTKFKFGATGGIYVNIPVNKNFSIQPELLYSGQGYTYDFAFSDESYVYDLDTKIKTDYLTLPVLAKYKFENGLVVELGPQVSYLLEGQINQIVDKKVGNDVIHTSSTRIYLNDVDLVDELDFAGVVGVGYELKGGYSINARYTHGFTDFTKYDGDIKIKNQYFSLTVAIPFIK